MKASASVLSDEAIEKLETCIPQVAAGATYAAYVRALAAGHTVVRVEGANLVATSADGAVEVLAPAKPKRKVAVGQVIRVR